jgi:hypothetical protein
VRGVTARQFAQMCAEHIPPYMQSKTNFPQTEFLDRCVERGLLTREGNRYVPTTDLARCLPPKDDDYAARSP